MNSTLKQRFFDLHQSGTFLMVNVHDVGAAAVAEAAGAVALGTTSGGHAWGLGRRDGVGALLREEVLEQAAAICSMVGIPLSVDAENGWGHSPEEVAETIRLIASTGAAGASIEDWSGDDGMGIYELALATERIVAAVETASSLPEPFIICARAEGFRFGTPNPLDDALVRLQSFAAAGADLLYAPGTRDRETLAALAAGVEGPLNALIVMGSTMTMADAEALGIRRVSIGGTLYRSLMGVFDSLVHQMVETGDFSLQQPALSAASIEALLD
jgi:2-methylisocitrate lyase-like PEP mutase family enzyme